MLYFLLSYVKRKYFKVDVVKNILYVGLGGFLGACCRYLLVTGMYKYLPSFPYGVLFANILGSFFAGVLFALSVFNSQVSLMVFTGFLGAFTTFSTFSLDTITLLDTNRVGAAILNIFLNVTLCILSCGVGYYISKTIVRIYVR